MITREFQVAAYRFGHSQVRPGINQALGAPITPEIRRWPPNRGPDLVMQKDQAIAASLGYGVGPKRFEDLKTLKLNESTPLWF